MGRNTIDRVRRVLSRSPKRTIDDASLAPAGVLVLLCPRDGEYRIVLTRRSTTVGIHKGEISFPGGRMDDADRTLVDTALREACEEIGVRPEDVEVLGELDDTIVGSSYVMSPVVGTVSGPYEFRPDEREVAEIIEIPLSALRDAGALRDEVRIVDGELAVRPSYAYRGRLVFGATASVLARFLELLEGAPDGEAP